MACVEEHKENNGVVWPPTVHEQIHPCPSTHKQASNNASPVPRTRSPHSFSPPYTHIHTRSHAPTTSPPHPHAPQALFHLRQVLALLHQRHHALLVHRQLCGLGQRVADGQPHLQQQGEAGREERLRHN